MAAQVALVTPSGCDLVLPRDVLCCRTPPWVRPFKCHTFYTNMISGKKEFTSKSE